MAGLSAGMEFPSWMRRTVPGSTASGGNDLFGSPALFGTAVQTQMGDYDKIMDAYNQLGSRNQTFNPLTPTLAPDYAPSAGFTTAINNLSDLSITGGYSPSGIADIRARGIAPVRSIYSTAQRGLERQKNLSGGYAPGYGASASKMAREMADVIGQRETDINATIAENVARNRLSGSGTLASAAGEADRMRMAREEANANIVNEINKLNESIRLQVQAANNQNLLASAEGMRSLFGTTPAMTQMFGNQVAQAAQLGQGQQQINNSVRRAGYGAS